MSGGAHAWCTGVLLGVVSMWTCCTSVLQSECGCVNKCAHACTFTLGPLASPKTQAVERNRSEDKEEQEHPPH